MPQTRLPDSVDDTRSADGQFLDLLLADHDLLQAEFDAIIAAEWPGPPPNLPGRRVRGGPDPSRRRRHAATAATGLRAGRRPPLEGSARQRSPPSDENRPGERGDRQTRSTHSEVTLRPARTFHTGRPILPTGDARAARALSLAGRTTVPSHRGPGQAEAGTTPPAACTTTEPHMTMTTEPIDCYAILGLPRDATQAQIGAAYRTLLRRYHPDTRTPGDSSRDHNSDAALQHVLAAYSVLHDPARRLSYDQQTTPRTSPARTPAQPIHLSRTQQSEDPPLRAGPVHWTPDTSRGQRIP